MKREPIVKEPIVREAFVFQSTEKKLVERTAERLNEIDKNNTYSIDKEDGMYYVFIVEDEDDI